MIHPNMVAKAAFALLVWIQVSCASMSTATIMVESELAGAIVVSDGYYKGETPVSFEVSKDCQITVSKVGHKSHKS